MGQGRRDDRVVRSQQEAGGWVRRQRAGAGLRGRGDGQLRLPKALREVQRGQAAIFRPRWCWRRQRRLQHR